MIRTIEAIINENEEPPASDIEPALLSEAALAEEWNRPEEDEAWAYLQREPSCWPHSDDPESSPEG